MQVHKINKNQRGFPELLQNIPDAPDQLYFSGDLAVTERPCLAIVGSRNSTPYGEEIAFQWAKELARAGVVIVSGLAFGIDAAAHRGALAGGGKTIAVLAQGLPHIQPVSHLDLAEEILRTGGLLLSEWPTGYAALKHTFLIRNRLISGLCNGVVVVEAADRSGALNTAKHANEQGRGVMVVPGRIHDPMSQGCFRLLREYGVVVRGVKDIVETLGWKFVKEVAGNGSESENLSVLEQKIVVCLENEAMTGAELLEILKVPWTDLSTALIQMEFKGLLKLGSGNRYTILPA